MKKAKVLQGEVLLKDLPVKVWGQIRQTEFKYAASGKWKTDGCLCGAGPTKIQHIHCYSGRPVGDGRIEMHHLFRCVECKELYENVVEQKIR